MRRLRSLLARLRRRKSLEDLARDQAAEQRFFEEREARVIDRRDWPER